MLHRTYDPLGRLTELRDDSATGTLRASWLYDTLAKGQPTSATRHHGGHTYLRQVAGYTDLYQPTGVTNTIPASQGLLAGTYTTGYGYHPDGTLASTLLPAKGGLPAETITGSYTDEGYLAGVTGLDTYLASAQYHWHGALKQQTLGSGTTRARLTTTIEDATGRLTKSEVHTEGASPDVLQAMIKAFAQAVMSAEADAICGAGYGQRSEERVNSRNGYRLREWDTRAGTIDLAIPKLRQGAYFPDWLLTHRRRAEQALVSVVARRFAVGPWTRGTTRSCGWTP